MRALLVADVDPLEVIGGAERLLAGHVRGLVERGHEVVVCSGAPGPEGEHGGARVLRIGRTPATLRRAAAAVEQVRPDVVMAYQPACAVGALAAAARCGIATVYVFSSSWPEEYATRHPSPRAAAIALRRAVEHACLRRSDRIVVLSEYSAAKVRALRSSLSSRIVVVPGGVDTARFSPNGGRHAARARLHLPSGGPLLVAVRNLVPRMGLDNLLAAMPTVFRTFPRARLVVVGAGPLRRTLEDQAARLAVDDRVTFVGFVPDDLLPDYYRAADLAVLPTRALEGFGLATIEALACATPVLATPVGATPEILGPLEPELLADGTGPEDLAAGMLRFLCSDPGDLSSRSREHVVSRYGWDVAVERLEAVVRVAVR